MARADPAPAPERLDRTGLIQGLGAYGIWGVLPLFYWLLAGTDFGEVVAMRVLWSVAFLAAVIVALRRGPAILQVLRTPRTMLYLATSSLLISTNWLVYIWAIQNHHVLESSLGYFLNPLVNVLIGVVLLREKLNAAQIVAVALAAVGVSVLAVGAGGGIWISLTLETLILAPVALGYLFWLGGGQGLTFGTGWAPTLLMIASGVVTAVPLLLFAAAARRLPYSTLGLLQYLAPTIGFILAITFFGETMTAAHMICFAFIWTGLIIFGAHGTIAARRRRLAETRAA